MNVSMLVFDLDGTLSDPSSGIVNCVNHALQQCGYDERPADEISAEIGPPLDLMFNKFFPSITTAEIDRLVLAYRERFVAKGYAENVLYDGIADVLIMLHESGFRLGVCTSKPERSARMVLTHFNLLHHFEFVSGGDIGIAKQSQLAELLRNKLIDEHAVMIGDRGVDLSAGASNELRTVGVLWGFGSRQELAAEAPTLIIDKVTDLLTSFTCTEASNH